MSSRALSTIWPNLKLALGMMRDHKMRSGLVVLGVTIGVATVMGMVGVLVGLQRKIEHDVKSSDNAVVRLAKVGIVIGGEGERLMRSRPDITPADWAAVQDLESVGLADYIQQNGENMFQVHHGSEKANMVSVFGSSTVLPRVYSLPILIGRMFSDEELLHHRRVAVIGFGPLSDLFPVEGPVGKRIRISGREYTVVGAFDERKSLFGGMADNFVVLPFSTYRKDFASRWNDFSAIDMVPAEGHTLDAVEQEVTALMRVRHKLRAGQDNDFEMVAQDQVQEFLGRILGPVGWGLFGVAIIGYLVGGIGVMAIMLVSVTERTREVGIRKAIGARRTDILWQFLIEASTLTGLGGLVGVACGMGVAWLLKVTMGVPAAAPVGYIILAVAGTAAVGIICGLYPALRAADLDPVEAMRQE